MKTNNLLLILWIVSSVFYCCEKEKPEANVNTNQIKNITTYSADCNSQIIGNGKIAVLSRGVCWSKDQEPTLIDSYTADSVGYGAFVSKIINLNANTTYYVRSYFISSEDTTYGNQIEFNTPNYNLFNTDLEYGTVTDIDGNVYKTIQIGDQVWMAENLRTTHYQNGDPINHVNNIFEERAEAYTIYDNDNKNLEVHGALYNWKAATDERNIAPKGWRVTTKEDWQKLINYLDDSGEKDYGHRLREKSTAHWHYDGKYVKASTNSTGFTSIASGRHYGHFMQLGGGSFYWTSSDSLPYGMNYVCLLNNQNHLLIADTPWIDTGMSIRCVKI